jgi:hypothetical protein
MYDGNRVLLHSEQKEKVLNKNTECQTAKIEVNPVLLVKKVDGKLLKGDIAHQANHGNQGVAIQIHDTIIT